MKAKPAAAAKPLSAVEEMLAKRDAMMNDRDFVLSKLMELNAGIESLDNVIGMFDPNHVPLDIRRAQSAPMLTISAQPILAEVAKTVSAEEAKLTGKEGKAATKANPKSKAAAKSTGQENVKVGRPPKKSGVEAPAPQSDNALAEAVAAKAATKKADAKDKNKKKVSAAREQIKEYFGDIDKLKTLEDIVKSSADGVPFRSICEAFAERHPIDIRKPEVKKVFSDRLSTLLHGLSQQNVVKRGERQGAEGKENVWLYARGQQASAEVAA
jgi:hypothetical protein